MQTIKNFLAAVNAKDGYKGVLISVGAFAVIVWVTVLLTGVSLADVWQLLEGF